LQLQHRDERLKEERRELMTLKDAEIKCKRNQMIMSGQRRRFVGFLGLRGMGLGDYVLGSSHS
jgi:hypothetical protein